MTPITELDVPLLAFMSPGDRLLVAAQVRHETTRQGVVAGRRDHRALRSRAMVGLAVAWTDPVWRQRWRAAGL